MADITIVNGVYKPTYNWGAPSCNITPITMVCETKDGNPQTDRTFAHLEIVGRLKKKVWKHLEHVPIFLRIIISIYKR